MIFHTDRGSQYASADFRSTVSRYGGLQSMSGPGSPYDNACAESFFHSLKSGMRGCDALRHAQAGD